jgi:hypothetical protein
MLGDAASLTRLASLALFDDAGRGSEVVARLTRDAGAPLARAFERCGESATIAPAEAVDLVRLASQLVAWFRSLA